MGWWGDAAAPTCPHSPTPSRVDPSRLPKATSTLGRSGVAGRGTLPGASGCLKHRACGVAAVAMEQQDKKQVSLVASCCTECLPAGGARGEKNRRCLLN